MNKGLAQYEFFCGNEITAADIVIYNELKQVLTLHKRDLVAREAPDLFSWFGKIAR